VTPETPARTRPRFRFLRLEVWQEARALNRAVYRASGTFPEAERFGLTSQIRRAPVSVAANIAEGCGRNSGRDFAHFLEQAYASAMELGCHLFLASDLGYLAPAELAELLDHLHQTSARIAALNRSLGVTKSKVRL
jgi:four helix bundle protein